VHAFAAIPFIQFASHLSHRLFQPFTAIPFSQFAIPLPSSISPFADIPLSQLEIMMVKRKIN
jgi:hypothetical protein